MIFKSNQNLLRSYYFLFNKSSWLGLKGYPMILVVALVGFGFVLYFVGIPYLGIIKILLFTFGFMGSIYLFLRYLLPFINAFLSSATVMADDRQLEITRNLPIYQDTIPYSEILEASLIKNKYLESLNICSIAIRRKPKFLIYSRPFSVWPFFTDYIGGLSKGDGEKLYSIILKHLPEGTLQKMEENITKNIKVAKNLKKLGSWLDKMNKF